MSERPHLPLLRFGEPYRSLEVAPLAGAGGGPPLAEVGLANAGLIRRDAGRASAARARLRALDTRGVLDIAARAADHFMTATLPWGDAGEAHDLDGYLAAVSATTGLPRALCRQNAHKIDAALRHLGDVLAGLSRDLPEAVHDRGWGADRSGRAVSYVPTCEALGVVLPSNSPGVNALWLPAIGLRTPVILKPGAADPWTPRRLRAALVAAGLPPDAISILASDHAGAEALLEACGRALLFGSGPTVRRWLADPRVEVHGPGRSKVLIGPDRTGLEPTDLDAIVASIADNSGRSCVNACTVVTSRGADALADALAKRLAAITPRPADDPEATLAGFVDPAGAEAIDRRLDAALEGATDRTAHHRGGTARRVTRFGQTFLLPTLFRCPPDHALAALELPFPCCAVVEVAEGFLVDALGDSLAVMALTDDDALRARLLASPRIDRLHLGPSPTSRVAWDQPHEGNLFELLFRRRALGGDPP